MSFFGKLFKKKKGGTFFGNLLRGAASTATGGILGQGAQLAKSDAAFAAAEQKEYEKSNTAAILSQNAAYLRGKTMTKSAGAAFAASPQVKEAKTSAFLAGLKQNWMYVTGGVVALATIVYLLTRSNTSKRKTRK